MRPDSYLDGTWVSSLTRFAIALPSPPQFQIPPPTAPTLPQHSSSHSKTTVMTNNGCCNRRLGVRISTDQYGSVRISTDQYGS
eukprot:1392492-Rhodomonas_salina.1